MLGFILISACLLSTVSLVLSIFLLYLNSKWKVEVDPRVSEIEDALPGINCGACGYPGCSGLAKGIVEGVAQVNACTPGGKQTADMISNIMGISVGNVVTKYAVVFCNADLDKRLRSSIYVGIQTCEAASFLGGNNKCQYGCLGLGDCVIACTFDALQLENGLPVTNWELCTGCGLCVKACPQNIIHIVEAKQDKMLVVKCSSYDRGADVKKSCKTGCTGCKICVKRGPKGLFSVEDNLSSVNYGNYDGNNDIQEAIEKCPTKVIIDINTKNLLQS